MISVDKGARRRKQLRAASGSRLSDIQAAIQALPVAGPAFEPGVPTGKGKAVKYSPEQKEAREAVSQQLAALTDALNALADDFNTAWSLEK